MRGGIKNTTGGAVPFEARAKGQPHTLGLSWWGVGCLEGWAAPENNKGNYMGKSVPI